VRPWCLGAAGLVRRQNEDVAAHLRAAGEHLLTVDDPVVAGPDRRGLGRGHVGARVGLAVAEGDQQLAPQRGRQVRPLLLLGADVADGVDHHARRRPPVDVEAAAGALVEDRPGEARVDVAPAVLR
jgi:hypothetical protein